ncbi:phage integrase N-terminal SAM-like domain-containing protein [Fimbriiglobus ruber]|nr:phage integrase N-terminal SAM-like domain-containing protein [Fimbriiglobus ruber]
MSDRLSRPEHPPGEPKLLDRLRAACRVRHYSLRTEDAYHDWVRRFILFHGKRHPADMAAAEITAFLTHLAVDGGVGASTQNQAYSGILFLYRHVLRADPGVIAGVVRAHRPKRLPVVLTRPEVRLVLRQLDDPYRLVAHLLYGSGLRLLEALRLRVKDLDFARRELMVREGKGNKDRVTMLPASLEPELLRHLDGVRRVHEKDLAAGGGAVYLPAALDRKLAGAAVEWKVAVYSVRTGTA